MKKILLANIYSGLYHGQWVGLAPYVLRAYASKFDISKQYEIKVVQFHNKHSVKQIVDKISLINPDIVGLSLYVYNSEKTFEVTRRLSCKILLGGPQVTGVEKELLNKHKNIDIIVTGEGEKPFVGILEYFAGKQKLSIVPGVSTREFQIEADKGLVDLNAIPSVYQEICDDLEEPTNICFETFRGCVFQCGFCAWSYNKKVRYYDLERVLKELEIICTNKHVKVIQSADASLFINRKRAKAILDRIIKLAPNKEFYFEINIEHLDDELIDLMAKLPNQEFSFGIQAVGEQANKEMNRTFNKKLFEDNFNKMSKKLNKANLHVDLLFPLPGDTLQGFKDSIEFALNLKNLHFIKFNSLMLLPGAYFFKNREKFKFILKDEKSRLVESCHSFPKEDKKHAIRYANYTLILHSNSRFEEVMKDYAKDNDKLIIDAFEEIVNALPFDLFDGEEYTEMITDNMTDEELILRLVPALFNYKKMVKYFKEYTQGKYNNQLVGWNKAFVPLRTIKFNLYINILIRRIKMIFVRYPNPRRIDGN